MSLSLPWNPAVAVADGDHRAVGADDGVGAHEALGLAGDGGGLAREAPARLLVEEDDVAAPTGGRNAAEGEERLERLGADAALLHARAGVGGDLRDWHGGLLAPVGVPV